MYVYGTIHVINLVQSQSMGCMGVLVVQQLQHDCTKHDYVQILITENDKLCTYVLGLQFNYCASIYVHMYIIL